MGLILKTSPQKMMYRELHYSTKAQENLLCWVTDREHGTCSVLYELCKMHARHKPANLYVYSTCGPSGPEGQTVRRTSSG